MLTGSLVAIATPMREGGALDLDALRALIDWHVAEGTAGIVVVGTTGESPTVDVEEHHRLIKVAVDHAAGRVAVVAGTGANSTAEALALTRYAKDAGADSCLSVVPYYNKPTQEGLYRHFCAVAEVGLPVILYNVPGRTVADLANDTVLRLARGGTLAGEKVNLGGIHHAPGRTQVRSYLYLDDADRTRLRELEREGVAVFARDLPDSLRVDLDTLLRE